MAGSGTSADPYIVETWADFKSYINQRGKYIRFAADIEPTGSDTSGVTINWNARNVDGDGHTINNFTGYFNVGTASDCFNETKNLKFRNFDNRNSGLFISGSTTGATYTDIINCSFEGYTRASYLLYFGSMGYFCPRVSRCSFNLRLGNSSFQLMLPHTSSSYNSPQTNNCNVKLKYEGVTPDGTINLFYTTARNIFLNIEDGNNGTILLNNIGDSIIIGKNVSIANTSSSDMVGRIVYDSDNITMSGEPVSTRFRAMTNADIKNVSALQAVGFPIE